VKFGIGALLQKVPSLHGFHENWLSGRHTLVKGENELLFVISLFLTGYFSGWVEGKLAVDHYLMPLSTCEFHENVYIEVILYFCPILYMFRSIRIKFGTAAINNHLLSHSEFRENGRRGSHTLIRGIYEFLTALSTSIFRFG
jgi:hypothetical protein